MNTIRQVLQVAAAIGDRPRMIASDFTAAKCEFPSAKLPSMAIDPPIDGEILAKVGMLPPVEEPWISKAQ